MIISKQDFLDRAQLDRETLEVWIEEEWLVPEWNSDLRWRFPRRTWRARN